MSGTPWLPGVWSSMCFHRLATFDTSTLVILPKRSEVIFLLRISSRHGKVEEGTGLRSQAGNCNETISYGAQISKLGS